MKAENRPTKYFSTRQEKTVARALKGSAVGGSGCSKFSLGDVRLDHVLIECKTSTTDKGSYSVKKEVLNKIKEESRLMGKFYSMLAFNFGPNSENYYVIDEDTAKFLINKIDEEYR